MKVIDREWSIDINGFQFISTQRGSRQFRVVFNVEIKPGNMLSLADISIYNLSPETIIERGNTIVLRAGFTDSTDVIFSGLITNVFVERDAGSPDIRTRLICRSGSAQERGSVNTTYGPGSRVTDVIAALAEAWPVRLDIDLTQFEDAPLLVSGYVASGDIPTQLDELAYGFNFEWILDNGRLAVNRLNRPRNVKPRPINQFTGMQGIPEVTKGPNGVGLFVSVRLNPAIRIYDRIEVQSRYSSFNTGNMYFSEVEEGVDANGEYNVFGISHRGDSHGNVWSTEIDGLRNQPEPVKQETETGLTDTLIWGARVTQEFRAKVREICNRLNINPNWLMAVMAFETGRTFSPSIKNKGSSATGLIQFTEATARGDLKTTTAQLARMTAVQQLDYVEKYLQPRAARINNLGDCYMAVLWHESIGKPDSYVMWEAVGPNAREYAANSGLDINRDGKITRGEACSRVNAAYVEGQRYPR